MNIKKIKWLLPILAVLIILESVLIVDKITKNQREKNSQKNLKVAPKKEEEVKLALKGQKDLNIGEEGEIAVTITSLRDLNLDGVDLLLNYDPESLEIVGVVPSDRFSYVGRNWIEPDKNRVLVSLIENNVPTGASFLGGEEVNLLTLRVRPLKEGKTKISFLVDAEGSSTVLAENGTAVKVPFEVENISLTVK